jgi:hypothetical protein
VIGSLQPHLGQKNFWIRLSLVGVKSDRDAIGAKLTLRVGDQKLVRWLPGGSSYLSSHDKRVLFGSGNLAASHFVDVEIVWPNGWTQVASSSRINRYHRIVEQVTKQSSLEIYRDKGTTDISLK